MKRWLKKLYPRLPIIRELREIRELNLETRRSNLIQINAFIQNELMHSPKYRDPRKLNHFEHQVFSQHGEDGIIAEIFRRIGTKDRIFVEFGVGDGLENNTTFLLTQGWKGSWIEGDSACVTKIRSHFRVPIGSGSLNVLNNFITADNIESLFRELQVPLDFDFLSLDIDRNTYHIWQALNRFQPRVIAVEYNATFPADIEWIANYEQAKTWNNSAYFGASLKAFDCLAKKSGYSLVGCDFSGTNAFFVRNTEPLHLFANPLTPENHYEPVRYWMGRREAHARCFDDRF